MEHQRQRMADALDQMRIMLEAAHKPEALAVLERFGYPAARLDDGHAHHQAAEQAYLKAQREESQALGTFQALQAAIERAHRIYMGHVTQARTIFRGNRELLSKLDVLGRRKLDRAGWQRQASDFYEHARDDEQVLELFARHGIELSAGFSALQEVQRLRVEHKRERAEARQARMERDIAFLVMSSWRKVFISVARQAFREAPRLLGQLGI